MRLYVRVCDTCDVYAAVGGDAGDNGDLCGDVDIVCCGVDDCYYNVTVNVIMLLLFVLPCMLFWYMC